MLRLACLKLGFNPDTSGINMEHVLLLSQGAGDEESRTKAYAADQQAKAMEMLIKKGILKVGLKNDGPKQ